MLDSNLYEVLAMLNKKSSIHMSIHLVAWGHENARIEFVALKYLLFVPLLNFVSPLHSSFLLHSRCLSSVLLNFYLCFRHHEWSKGHAPTNYAKWRSATTPYTVRTLIEPDVNKRGVGRIEDFDANSRQSRAFA